MSSPLNDDVEFEEVDVDLGDEGAVAEVVTWGSVAAKAYWMSMESSSSLSASMVLYSKASEGFGSGAMAAIG